MKTKDESLDVAQAVAKLGNMVEEMLARETQLIAVVENIGARLDHIESHGPPDYGHYKGIEP